VHGEEWQKCLPELFAKSKSCNGIGDWKYAGQQQVYRKAERRLASHFCDVTGKPNGDEDEEDSQQEKKE
jgi:hypothetical protein